MAVSRDGVANRLPTFVALDHAIACQQDRRSMNDAEFVSGVGVVDKRRPTGSPDRNENGTFKPFSPIGKHFDKPLHVATAEVVGRSPRQVSRARAVIDYAGHRFSI
jgi:hypothetical protein